MKSTAPQHAITDALVALRDGEPDALERLVPLVYDHLSEMAHHHLRLESTGHTLSTTAVVHEAYLRLVDQTSRMGRPVPLFRDRRAGDAPRACRPCPASLCGTSRRPGTPDGISRGV